MNITAMRLMEVAKAELKTYLTHCDREHATLTPQERHTAEAELYQRLNDRNMQAYRAIAFAWDQTRSCAERTGIHRAVLYYATREAAATLYLDMYLTAAQAQA